MANEILVTPEGFEKLKKELEELKGPVRMQIAEAIREAKSHGDLRENAAYHEAKLNQERLESRIAELEKAVQLARIVVRQPGGGAQLGAVVKLLDQEFDDEFSVTLVGDFESDADQNRISISSPLGTALLGKAAGESIEVQAPAGKNFYKILSVD
jgi:transcription elongation factor GreA